MLAKQSTSVTLIVGPILDSTGAEYSGAVIGDLSISKNGGTLTALAAAATLTHVANGQYTLVLTTGNTDTLGVLQITCNKSTYQMRVVERHIVPANIYDSIVLGSDLLDISAVQWLGAAIATPSTAGLPDVNAKQAGGVAWASGAITAAAIGADAITAAKIADGAIDAATFAAGAINAAAIGADAITDAKVASDVTIASVTGSVGSVVGMAASDVAAIKAKTDNLPSDPADQSLVIAATDAVMTRLGTPAGASVSADVGTVIGRLPTALVGGRIDASVGAMAAGVVTATAIAADAITASKIADGAIDAATFAAGAINAAAIATDAITAAKLAADAVTEIQAGLATSTNLAIVAGYLDTEIGTLVSNVAAVLADTNELQTDWANGGRLDLILDAAGSAGDPWITALPGAYAAGTAGEIVGNFSGGGGGGLNEQQVRTAVTRAVFGSRAGVLGAAIEAGEVLDVVRTVDFSLDIPVAVASSSTLVWTVRNCPADARSDVEIVSGVGLLKLVSVETPTAGDGAVVRVDAQTVRVTLRARSQALLSIGSYVGELREITTTSGTIGRYEVGLQLRDSAGRTVA